MEPVNENTTPNARGLLQYLSSMGGHGIVTGQHTQTMAMEEIDENRGTLAQTLAFGREGGILTFTWHGFFICGMNILWKCSLHNLLWV